jgi:lysozyme
MGEDFCKMTNIKLTDAAKYFKNTPEQIDAFNYLEKNIPSSVLEEFGKRYRTSTKTSSKIPQQAIDLIKQFEGFSAKAYYDPLTNSLPITIGYGSTRRRDGTRFMIGNTVTQAEANDLLSYQLETEYIPTLSKIPYWNEMNDEMKSALISFAYNLGVNFYGSSEFGTITRHLKDKLWKNIPDALVLYVNPGTNVTEGLRRRRRSEGSLWNSGLSKLS